MRYLAVSLLLAAGIAASHPSARALDAAAFVVCDATTGYILDSSAPNAKRQVASLTKIATAMIVLDWAELAKHDVSEIATVSAGAAAVGGINAVGFQPGDRVSIRDLLYAALLQSDNIAAQALAEHVGASIGGEGPPGDRFVAQMNALARKLGMKNTRFLNPHGIEGGEKALPYSTAADMARLARYAMASSAFRFYVSQPTRQISIIRPDGTSQNYLLKNTNELLGINEVDGVKTGKTRRAGECVIISSARSPETAVVDGQHIITPRRIIVVVLGSNNRFAAASALHERGWQLYDAWAATGRKEKRGRML